MLKVGLTGGIGSGKSTASAIFRELGAYVFDADKEAKHLLDTHDTVQSELIAEFGTDILNPEGHIDRKKLARVSFQDENHQQQLNAVVHPYLFEVIDRRFKKISKDEKHTIFIVDGALIFESGLDQHLDYVISVTSLIKNRMERALNRGTLTREDILRRMDLQWPCDEKVSMADFVMKNDGPPEELRDQINEILTKIV